MSRQSAMNAGPELELLDELDGETHESWRVRGELT